MYGLKNNNLESNSTMQGGAAKRWRPLAYILQLKGDSLNDKLYYSKASLCNSDNGGGIVYLVLDNPFYPRRPGHDDVATECPGEGLRENP